MPNGTAVTRNLRPPSAVLQPAGITSAGEPTTVPGMSEEFRLAGTLPGASEQTRGYSGRSLSVRGLYGKVLQRSYPEHARDKLWQAVGLQRVWTRVSAEELAVPAHGDARG